MGDTYPPRDLGGTSDHWGRFVEIKQDSLESRLEQLEQTLANTGKASSGTMGALGDQVRDLVERVSYSGSDVLVQTWNNNITLANVGFGSTLTFELSEPRVVSITTYVNAALWARAGNGAASTARLRGGILLDGSVIPSSAGVVRTGLTNNATYADQSVAGVATARALLPLSVGVHSVRAVLSEVYADTVALSGATGSATVEASNPFVFVDVLQRA